jgi:hypothetical protein
MDKLLLTPTEAASALGIGRSKVYELLQTGQLAVGPDRCLAEPLRHVCKRRSRPRRKCHDDEEHRR